MKIQAVEGCSFGAKSTYCQKSKQAHAKSREIARKSNSYLAKAKSSFFANEASYYKSLHLEALARVSDIEANKANEELAQIGKISNMKEAFKVTGLYLKRAFNRFNAAITMGDAYGEFPERFKEPDNFKQSPKRYYNY